MAADENDFALLERRDGFAILRMAGRSSIDIVFVVDDLFKAKQLYYEKYFMH